MVSPGLPSTAPKNVSGKGEHDGDLEKPSLVKSLICMSRGRYSASGEAEVLPGGNVKKFVTLLNDGKIRDGAFSVEYLKMDNWLQWLYTSIGAVSLAITDTEGVLGFELHLGSSTTSDLFLFTSAGFSAALGLASSFSSSDPGAASGLPGNGETLIFGLDPPLGSPKLTMNLPEIFEFAGLHDLANVLPFLDGITLEIDDGQLSRNAIWFEPKNSYRTVVRLQFTVPFEKILDFFTEHLLTKTKGSRKEGDGGTPHTFKLTAAYVVVKKTLREMGWQPDRSRFSMEADVTLVAECSIQLPEASIEFSVALTFYPRAFGFDLVPRKSDTLANVLVWLGSLVEIDITQWLENMKNELGMGLPELTRISLTFATGQLTPIYIRLEMKVTHQEAVLLFSYRWSKGGGGKLKAELWPKSPMSALAADQRKLDPDWERYLVFNESGSTPMVLTSFFKADDNPLTAPPSELGEHMSHLVFEVGGSEIALYGRLSLQTAAESGFSFDSITFSGRYRWGATKQIDISFAVSCSLQGKHDKTPAYMTGKILYATLGPRKKLWTLSASIENLSISALEKFLGSTSSNEIMPFIGKLQIVSLDITYTFPSIFFSKGILRLGDLELDLTFTHEEHSCDFEATLRPTGNESTIGKVLDSITGCASLDLPSFVADIKLGGDAGGGGSLDIVRIKFSRNATDLFVASFHIGPLKFTFLQHRGIGSEVIKRVIKVSAQLPSFKIPMVDHPVQPFGELFYMWVHAPVENTAPAGFTADEVTEINAQLTDQRDHLVFKTTTEQKNVSVIAEGSHFVLIGEETGTVTMDYVFQKSAKYVEPNTPAGGEKGTDALGDSTGPSAAAAADSTPEGPPGETHMAAYKKSIGPLSISNIGLQYKDNVLHVHVDAELLLGPIGLSLLGLTIEARLNGEFNLQKIPIDKIKVSLDGMAVSFDQSPIEIAGLFKHSETATEESYGGGLIVGFDPYRFEAAGVYTKTKGDHGFKSVFVFGKLEGPLVILEFAEISGITGGFGYNIDLKLPQVTEVLQFPFLADISSEPEEALSTMFDGGFFKPSEGSFWVAAGLKVKAFQALTVDAVVVVSWNPYVSLGIFGVAVVDVPKLESEVKLLRVELGFAATVDFRSGVMKFEGQLTQNSYILSPACHLTGGFAIYYWFPAAAVNPALEGDWVVTVGGYHRQFTPPAHYPKPPPRLGISWKVSEAISVAGEAYFAITPKVCMGGVRLHATLSFGPLDAYFDAHADFLINFDPFHFVAEIGVSVGVRYNVDCWFVSTHISVELDAQLHLEGPPFSGRLYVDFYIHGFSVNFGPSPVEVEKANLERFYQLVVQEEDSTKAKVEDGQLGQNDHVLGCLAGMIADGTSSPKKGTAAWNVRAGDFSFHIACRFPINSATINSVSSGIPNTTPIYAKPMELTNPLSSTMGIDIKRAAAGGETVEWRIAGSVKNVPCALWGRYDSRSDPMKHKDPASLLEPGNPTIPLIMGITISAPSPRLPEETSLPFNPALQNPKDAFSGNEPHFPTTSPARTQWHPAKPLENAGEKGVIANKQWDEVSEKWKESLGQEATVEKWRSAFSWKATLKAKAPDRLIEKFGILYMAAPMLTEG